MKTLVARKWLAALAVALLFMAGILWVPLATGLMVGIGVPVALRWNWKLQREQPRRPARRPGPPPPRGLTTLHRLMFLYLRSVVRFFAKSPYRLLVFLIVGASVSLFVFVWSCFHPEKQGSRSGLLGIGGIVLYSAGAVWYAGRIRGGTWQQFWQRILECYP